MRTAAENSSVGHCQTYAESSQMSSRRRSSGTLEHAAMPARELLRVRLGRVGEAPHRALAEEEAEHAADVPAGDLRGKGETFSDACKVLRLSTVFE